MPLADVEGSPLLKLVRSAICLSASDNCAFSFSSCFWTEATYCASTGLVGCAFDFEPAFESPTTETAPFASDRLSLFQVFFGCLASGGLASPCAWEEDCGVSVACEDAAAWQKAEPREGMAAIMKPARSRRKIKEWR